MRNAVLVFALSLASVAACGGPSEPTSSPSPSTTPSIATSAGTVSTSATPTANVGTVKRVVVSLTRPSGTHVTTTAADGTITVAFDELENGRGPHVDATLRLAPDGTIASLEAHGHHTMGTKVEETFTRKGDHATWKSLEESAETDVSGKAFFVPISEIPEVTGILARALIANGGPMNLLPAGTASIEKTLETSATSKSGEKRHLVGYAITGLDLTPTHVWMNDDGTWFGIAYPWFSVVPEGFEDSIDALVAAQNDWNRKRDAKIYADLAHQPKADGLAYVHARVLDVEHGKWLKDQTVIVVGSKIDKVGPSATTKPPKDAEIVDLAGKALLPGLWDMHSHLGDADGVLDIASGVTTARDVGNDPDELDDYKKRYDNGQAVGPHVLRFGFIEGRGEKAASSKVTAETPDEAKAAVEFYAKRGYDGIKIYNSVKPELVPLITKEAHVRGMQVTGHIPVHMLAHEAVEAGYDGIEHVNMLFLNFFATHDTDTRDTTRFTLVGDKAASFDLKSKPVKDFFDLVKKHHTLIDPTIDAFEDLLVGQQGKIIPGLETLVGRLPVQVERWFLEGGLPMDADKTALYAKSFEKLLEMVKAIHDEKIPLVVGTDMLAGLMLHHELALYVRAKIPAADALREATLDAAKSMKMDKTTGSIAAGKTADMFVVDGDPLANIADVGKIVSTMRAGIVFSSPDLYAKVGVRPLL